MSRRVSWCLVLLLSLAGCNTLRFRVSDEDSARTPVVDRKAYFFWGLTTQDVDVSGYCPNGAVAVDEETTFLDGLLGNLTLGIYAPRTSYYWCRLAPGGKP